MGYTHYYKVKDWSAPEWQTAWPQLIKDISTIINAAPDIPLCGPDFGFYNEGGDEESDEGSDEESLAFTPPIVDIKDGIWINGVGEDSFEDFILRESDPNGFCKTARRPYDLVVACVLLRAYRLAPGTFQLMSDGAWDQEWVSARELYHGIWPNDPDEKPPDLYERASD